MPALGAIAARRKMRVAAGAASCALLITPALADPPVLVTAPPVVLDFTQNGLPPTVGFTSLRNLDDPIPDLSTFVPATGLPTITNAGASTFWSGCFSVLGPGNAVIAQGTGVCGDRSPFPQGSIGNVPATNFLDGNGVSFGGTGGASENSILTSFSYTLFNTNVVNTTFVGGGVQAIVRIAGLGTQLSTSLAPTLSQAQADALAQTDFGFTRGRILPAIVNSGGVTESEVINSTVARLTGRDDFGIVADVIGGSPPGGGALAFAIVGNRGECSSFVHDCQGGIKIEVPGNHTLSAVLLHTDFYTTTTIDRTVTSTGTAFIDVPIAAEGVAHPAAQSVGLDLGDRFLRRLVSPGAASDGSRLGSTGEGARWSIFLEGAGGQGRFTDNDRFHFSALRGGVARAMNPNLKLGLAFEAGDWRYRHRDPLVPESADGDTWRLGAFARYTPDRWRLHAAVIGGEDDIDTTGTSLAGAGTSRAKYRAKVWGAGVEAGYAIPVEGFTLTPQARVTALRWSAPAFSESGGMAPLAVRKSTREQVRVALGASLGRVYEIEPGLNLGLELGARVFTTTGDRSGRVIASDGFASSPFAIDGPTSGRTGTELSAGVTLVKDDRMALTASYEGRFTGDENTHAGMLTLKISF